MKGKLYIYIVYLVLISLVTTGFSFSRFSTTLTSSDTGTPPGSVISNPIILYVPKDGLLDANDNQILLLNDISPGMPAQSYYFNIVNYNGTRLSDMSFTYTITFDTLGALPLEIELYHADDESRIPLIRNSSGQITMPNGTMATHRYRMDVSWRAGTPSVVNDYRYANEIDYINIIIKAQQAY